MVSERGLDVLRVIVQDYVATREPVGSRSIVDRHSFGVSAATIRNDMALLEDEELITAPHTSSGRVPTDKGYRVFVDRLQRLTPLTAAQRHAIARFLEHPDDVEDALQRAGRLLAQLTNQLAIVQLPSVQRAVVHRVEVVRIGERRALVIVILDGGTIEQRLIETEPDETPESLGAIGRACSALLDGATAAEAVLLLAAEAQPVANEDRTASAVREAIRAVLDPVRGERLLVAGASHLARTEGDFHGSLSAVLEAVDEQVTLLRLIGELEADASGLATSIGSEHAGGLQQASIVAGSYGPGGQEVARIGLIGPTRMDYPSNMAAVRAVARYLSRLLSEET